jgi:hypothetical protein
MLELIHTSAPRGLHGARGGYTVVAATEGMPEEMRDLLAESSALPVPRLGPGSDPAESAVVNVWPIDAGGAVGVVVSRAVPVASDHTGRPSRLTHHIVLVGDEASPRRVASLLSGHAHFASAFEGPPRTLLPRPAPEPADETAVAVADQELSRWTDDGPGWARHLGERCCMMRMEPTTLVLPTEADLELCAAAVVCRAERPTALRIATTTDAPGQASSVILLRAGTRPTPGEVMDWSGGRNGVPAPSRPAREPAAQLRPLPRSADPRPVAADITPARPQPNPQPRAPVFAPRVGPGQHQTPPSRTPPTAPRTSPQTDKSRVQAPRTRRPSRMLIVLAAVAGGTLVATIALLLLR